MNLFLLLVSTFFSLVGCAAHIETHQNADDELDEANVLEATNDGWSISDADVTTALTLDTVRTVHYIAKSWWGDVKTPQNNQLWTDARDATPGLNLTKPITFTWSCETPKQIPGVTAPVLQTLKITTTHLSVVHDGSPVKVAEYKSPVPGQVYSAKVDPSRYSPQWVEIRIRCQAEDVGGPDDGHRQFTTAAWKMQINGGTKTSGQHADNKNALGVHNHTWYDSGVGYIYPAIINLPTILDSSGSVAAQLDGSPRGGVEFGHFMIKLDDRMVLERFTKTPTKSTETVNTSGVTKFQFHVHGHSIGYKKGLQLASQAEVFLK